MEKLNIDIHFSEDELKNLEELDSQLLCFYLKKILLLMKSVGLGGIERDIQLKNLLSFLRKK